MRELGYFGGLGGICLVALALMGGAARAADTTMFDGGRAQHAFIAIQDKVGRNLRVLGLKITGDELSVEIPNADKPGEVETWRVSHKGFVGSLGVELPVRQGSARASIPGGGTIAENLIDIDAAGLAVIPKLAADALARARSFGCPTSSGRSSAGWRPTTRFASLTWTSASWPSSKRRRRIGHKLPVIAAAADPNSRVRHGRLCEANFYAGGLFLRSGRKDDAGRLFAPAANDCPLTFDEWQLGALELKAMAIVPPEAKP